MADQHRDICPLPFRGYCQWGLTILNNPWPAWRHSFIVHHPEAALLSVKLNYVEQLLTSMGTCVNFSSCGCCCEPHAYPQLLTSMGSFTHFTSREAAVGESTLSWTITDQHGDIHPFTLSRLVSVRLNWTIADQHGDTRPVPILRLTSDAIGKNRNYPKQLLTSRGTLVNYPSRGCCCMGILIH